MGDPVFCLKMLTSRVDFSDVGRNCAMNVSVWKTCPWAWMPEISLQMVAQTLPALPVRQGWPIRKELVSVERFSGTSLSGSHLFRPPIEGALGVWQPCLPFRHLSGTIFGDLRFSCILFWWDTMSSGTNLSVADQAGAAVATTEALPGTF